MGNAKPFLLGAVYGLVLALGATGLLLAIAGRPAGVPVVLAEPPTAAPVRVYVLGAVATPGVYPLPAEAIVEEALAAAGGALPEADLAAVNLAARVSSGDRIDVPRLPPTPAPTRRAPPAPTPFTGEGGGTVVSPTASASQDEGGAGRGATAAPPAADPQATGTININTATASQLEALPKIGPSIAQRIVEYRDTNGPFSRIEDLQKVKGIGPATFAALKDFITVGP